MNDIYSAFLYLSAYVSSSVILLPFLLANKGLAISSVIAIWIFGFLGQFEKLKIFKKINIAIFKLITILVSIFIVVLFVNSYFTFSSFLNSIFLNFWKPLEKGMSAFIISSLITIMSIIILPLLPLKIGGTALSFFGEKLNIKNETAESIKKLLLILSVLTTIVLIIISCSEAVADEIFNFSLEISDIFGFSLLSLHTNFLIIETKKLIKSLK